MNPKLSVTSPAYRLNLTLRCGEKNRQGAQWQAPAMRGRKRCRLHGGKATDSTKR
ncbi:HGGxSTG domain-containing protein [Parvularcula mediterranea]|uniref:HGGxSTG domain-containing protein n=1 Tax=Parvularcula mediterranea TaxID=2732508 RepID=UPI0038CD4D9D